MLEKDRQTEKKIFKPSCVDKNNMPNYHFTGSHKFGKIDWLIV